MRSARQSKSVRERITEAYLGDSRQQPGITANPRIYYAHDKWSSFVRKAKSA